MRDSPCSLQELPVQLAGGTTESGWVEHGHATYPCQLRTMSSHPIYPCVPPGRPSQQIECRNTCVSAVAQDL